MIIVSLPTTYSCGGHYFAINLFAKAFKHIGFVPVGDMFFFSLLENVSPKKYDWVVLKHVYKSMESEFYICSSLSTVWMKIKVLIVAIYRLRM